jgi:WD40 repeat protein
VVFTPGGRRVVSWARSERIQVRDVDSGVAPRTIEVSGFGDGVVLAPAGRHALVLPGKNQSATLWDLETGRNVANLDGSGRLVWNGACVWKTHTCEAPRNCWILTADPQYQ